LVQKSQQTLGAKIMNFGKFFVVLVAIISVAGCASGPVKSTVPVDHPSLLPPLTKDSDFPRSSNEELQVAGFPDHMHLWNYSSWETPVDEAGLAYGPGAFCENKTVIPREDVGISENEKQFGVFRMSHNPGYSYCDMLANMELLDYAWHYVPDLLGLTCTDELYIRNPDNPDHYKALTGYGTWRLYYLNGEDCIIQPYAVLQARTLDGHAAFMLVTDWLLQKNVGRKLPLWLHQGLVEYVGEDGVHLVNYMAQFRSQGSVLLSPPMTDAILGSAPDPDKSVDQEMFRKACYSSFLMVHQLVEHEGGLKAMREFLDLVASGTDLDKASRKVWDRDIAALAASLDPVKIGEPIGDAVGSRSPFKEPLISN
jgi:hypothetical protein